jgi:voltage-gated potassium channel
LPFIPALLIAVGSVGFYLLEDLSLFESLYMTVVTLTTIGYGDLVPRTDAGRIFTIILILGGVFTIFFSATEMIRSVVSGELKAFLEFRKMEQNLSSLSNHMIVCGFGRVGRFACREISNQRSPFVVIENNKEALAGFSVPHGVPLHGDATSDEILLRAGIKRAKALLAVAGSDADNLYITMSARLLNDKISIIARAEDENAEMKLQRAGANRVISPYLIGGLRLVQAAMRPSVVDFIDLATRVEHLALQIEELTISEKSGLLGVSLKDQRLRKDLGVIVLAVKKSDGHMLFNPPPETVLARNDTLIVIGDRRQLDFLEKLT